MGVFGQNEYGSPLGALDPRDIFNFSGIGFYDYSGFSSRGGDLGISGFSLAASAQACQQPGAEFIPWPPTLLFPLNYDVVVGTTSVAWREAVPQDACDPDGITYELQYTSSFSKGTGWRTLATSLPSGTTSHAVDFSVIPYTEDGGVRVRARDSRGLHSSWSTNINPFTVANHAPNPVRLQYPRNQNETFDDSITLLWKEPESADIDGHTVSYSVEVTRSFSADAGWEVVPEASALPRGVNAFVINTFDFPEGADYGARVVPVDQFGARGTPSQVRFRIRHEGNFIIDTVAPVGSAVINDGATLTSDPRVKLELSAEDVTTGIKDFRIRNGDEECWGDWDTFVPQKFWDLTGQDGLKRIFVQFRDYAGNVSESCGCEVVSRVLCGTGNVTDIQSSPQRLFASFDQEGKVVGYTVVAQDVANLEQEDVTALGWLSDDLYAAAYDSSQDETTVYRIRGSVSKTMTSVSGKITSMSGFQSGLYVGLESGFIKEILGSGVQYPAVGQPSLDPISRVRARGSLLVATAGATYVTYNGVTWQENSL